MPLSIFKSYAAMLPRIKARREMAAVRAASSPHLKKQDRAEYLNGLKVAARLRRPKPIPATEADIRAMGIQLEEVNI